MEDLTIRNLVLEKVPHAPPFRFIEHIVYLDEDKIEGNYFLDPEADFYKGHFPGFPVTPGVILNEIMGQIGMVAFGIYLMRKDGETEFKNMHTLMTETNIKFKKQALPNQLVTVLAEKMIFRHGKLQCKVQLTDAGGGLICYGTMSGMLYIKKEMV